MFRLAPIIHGWHRDRWVLRVPIVLAVVGVVLIGCREPVEEPEILEVEAERVCEGGVPDYQITVEPHLTEIGPSGNAIAEADDSLWIVESDANAVSRFDLDDESRQAGLVDVGTERNPYALDVDEEGGELWVTNFLSETVTVADLADGEVIEELDDPVFDRPSAVAVTGEYAYVANVEYGGLEEGYGPGSIAVVDRESLDVVTTLSTEFKNPHFLTVEQLGGEQTLLVSGSGAVVWDGERTRVESEGGLERFAIGEDPLDPPSEAYPLDQEERETVGAPGEPLVTPDGDELYFVSGIAPVVFAFDLHAEQWRYDAADPLRLYDAEGDATHRGAISSDGLLWVTAFNEDELHLIDTACDEPITSPLDVATDDELLEGPQAITTIEQGEVIEGYHLLSLASAMGRVRLEP